MIDDKLKTLLVLAEEKSFTKTAKICDVSQPAVSQHIKALEEQYNIKIFERIGREMIITTHGEILINSAKKMQALNNRMKKELMLEKNVLETLNIGITLTAGGYFIPEILNVFKNKFPNLRYNFHTDLTRNIYDRMRLFELDFAIIDGTPPENKEFESELLSIDELIFIAKNDHPLTSYEYVTLGMLKKENFILRHEEANTRKAFENYLSNHFESIENFNITLEIDNTSLIKQLIIAGHGISIMSKALCEVNLNVGTLKELKLKDFSLKRGIYLVYHKELSNGLLINELKKLKKQSL